MLTLNGYAANHAFCLFMAMQQLELYDLNHIFYFMMYLSFFLDIIDCLLYYTPVVFLVDKNVFYVKMLKLFWDRIKADLNYLLLTNFR